MTDSQRELSILVRAKGAIAAARDITKVDASVSKLGKTAASSLGRLAQTGEKGLGHLKDRLTGLAGPLGLIGVTAGLFTFTGALEQGITKSEEMALAVEKLTGVTGLSAHAASQLVAVFGRFGIETDKLTTVAGFAEKTLGKLSLTSSKGAKSTGNMTKAQEVATKAHERLAVASQRLHEVESKSKVSASTLIAARNRVADATRAVGAAETKLGAIRATSAAGSGGTSKLTALDKQYGLNLVDAKGKVVDFSQELNQVADFYNSNASASSKAAVAAQLFGKGYVAIIPVLKLGSKGIAEVAAKADELGLTLKTAEDVQNVHSFISAQRDASEAVGGLEVQLGLLAMPDLTTGLKGFTTFVAAHHEDIKRFFGDGIRTAEQFAGFVTGSVVPAISGLASAAKGFWDSIPAPLRDLLFKGIVADRTIHFLFGVSPIHFVADVAEGALSKGLGGILGALTQRGSSPANPVFVAGTGVGGIGGLAGDAGAAGAAGVGVGLLGASTAIGASIAASVVGSINTRNAVDNAIATGDVPALQAQAEAARKHGVSDSNNAALKALQSIVHNTASLAKPDTAANTAQDSSEKAIMALRGGFTSNPTRNELRAKIGIDKHDLEHATGKSAVDIGKHLTSLQNRLDNRIQRANDLANQVAQSSARAIVAAIDASKLVLPAPTVIVPVNVSFSARNAASAIQVTSIRSGTHPGGGGPQALN